MPGSLAQPAAACCRGTSFPARFSRLLLSRAVCYRVLWQAQGGGASSTPSRKREARHFVGSGVFRNVCSARLNRNLCMENPAQTARPSSNPRAEGVSSPSSDDHSISQIVLFLSMSIFLLTFRWAIDHPITLLVPFGMAISPGIGPAMRPVFKELGYLLVSAAKWLPTILKPRGTAAVRSPTITQPATTMHDPRQRPRERDILADVERTPSVIQGMGHMERMGSGKQGLGQAERMPSGKQGLGHVERSPSGKQGLGHVERTPSGKQGMGHLERTPSVNKGLGHVERMPAGNHQGELGRHFDAGNVMSSYDDWGQQALNEWDQQNLTDRHRHTLNDWDQQHLTGQDRQNRNDWSQGMNLSDRDHATLNDGNQQHLTGQDRQSRNDWNQGINLSDRDRLTLNDWNQQHLTGYHPQGLNEWQQQEGAGSSSHSGHVHQPLPPYQHQQQPAPRPYDPATYQHHTPHRPHHHHFHTPLYENVPAVSSYAADDQNFSQWLANPTSTYTSHRDYDSTVAPSDTIVPSGSDRASVHMQQERRNLQASAHLSRSSMDADMRAHPSAMKTDSVLEWNEGVAREWPAVSTSSSGQASKHSMGSHP